MRNLAIPAILVALMASACTGKGSTAMRFSPVSQQEVQETVAGQLRGTLAALPEGTVIDASRFVTVAHNSPCDDDDSGPVAMMRFHTIGELRTPIGTDAIAVVGAIWRDWGWQVVERAGFGTPNRFGYSPEGYRLQVVTVAAGHPPVLQASSPCFPRPIARDDIAFPTIITGG